MHAPRVTARSSRAEPPPASTSVVTGEQSALYSHNLGALRAVQLTVAGVIDDADLDDWVPATGRDGSPTFQRVDANGRRVWLGQSSMPTVSAQEVFCNARADSGNVSLPGILTGAEPLAILGRLPPYRGLFVIEDDPARFKLAMHLYDYAAELGAGRLAFILESDLPRRLAEYFERYPGCELPAEMFSVPQRSASSIAELQRSLEQSGEVVLRQQARAAETLARAFARRSRRELPDAPRTALLTLDPSAATLDQIHRIERALGSLGWPFQTCVPDRPDKCHVVARLQTIEHIGANWVLLMNSTAGALRAMLPVDLPIVSWFGPDAAIPATVAPAGPHDLFIASSRSAQERLMVAGVPEGSVLNMPPAADDAAFAVADFAGPVDETGTTGVALVMDVPDDRPEANGITLPSYVSLWQELQKAAARGAGSSSQMEATWVLSQAESSAGLKLSEHADREHILGLVRDRIIPAAISGATFRALRDARFDVGVWGSNWPAGNQEALRGPIQLSVVLRAARVVVLPWVSTSAIQMALDALAAGAQVVLRASPDFIAREHPELGTLLSYIRLYETVRQLVVTIQELSGSRDQRPRAGHAVCKEHTVSRRICAIRDYVRQRPTFA